MNTNKYQIWIESDGQKLLIPVNPPKIELKLQGNNKSVTLAELGEMTIPQAPKELIISFSSFLPARHYPFSDYGLTTNNTVFNNLNLENVGDYNEDGVTNIRDLAAAARDISRVSSNVLKVMPHYYINFITTIMNEKHLCRLYVIGCDIARLVTVESFSCSQKGGEVGEYDYTISFKGYREATVRQVQVKNGVAQLPKKVEKRVNTLIKPKTYTVKKGDTLCTIAKKYYGYVAVYKKIYEANKKIIGANPNMIRAGMVLTLP